ncbi:MAG: hypothetical protein ABH873_02735 [Candidatus Firestonebacteria bacterium]
MEGILLTKTFLDKNLKTKIIKTNPKVVNIKKFLGALKASLASRKKIKGPKKRIKDINIIIMIFVM